MRLQIFYYKETDKKTINQNIVQATLVTLFTVYRVAYYYGKYLKIKCRYASLLQ